LAFSAELSQVACLHLLNLPAQAENYEAALYCALRELDQLHLDCILVEKPPEHEDWMAVNDRLNKATI
jgi:L-threonylcarbamoyladenylate synthase